MPTQLRTLPFFVFLLFCLPVFANKVIVKGTVKYSNGFPAVNKAVYVMPDTAVVAGCNISHTVYTNANGLYIDTLSCSTAITKVRVRTADCNQAWLSRDPSMAGNEVIEISFSLSCNPPAACEAAFSLVTGDGERSIHFNSANSVGEDIISRKWYFGDGDSLVNNSKDPRHTYVKTGVYTACLVIKTAAGCESKVCKPVEVTGHCNAAFVSVLPATASLPATVKFNSSTSTGSSSTDNIIERVWSWGDGTSSTGNVDPSHAYSHPGTYIVCLKIITAQHCIDSACVPVVIAKPVAEVTCFTKFSIQNTLAPNTLKFTIDSVRIVPGDSVLNYRWDFGDGLQQSGLAKLLEHKYAITGKLTVCLVMKTKLGCEYKTCNEVTVAPATACKAGFSNEKLGLKKIRVNAGSSSAAAGDSIIQRRWDFGDGTILSGNTLNPAHEYAQFGNYSVCLNIKTARGCEASTCSTVKLEDSTHAIKDSSKGDAIILVQIYPNPASSVIHALVYSRNSNVQATLAIYDIYGSLKWSTAKTLAQGNNVVEAPISRLAAGPYVFRVTTSNGKQNKNFYKL